MKIVVSCKKCKREIELTESAKNRFELSKKIGVQFKLRCINCKNYSTFHINECKAKRSLFSRLVFPLALVLSAITVVALWDKDTRITSYKVIPICLIIINSIAAVIVFQNQQNVNYFNTYRIN